MLWFTFAYSNTLLCLPFGAYQFVALMAGKIRKRPSSAVGSQSPKSQKSEAEGEPAEASAKEDEEDTEKPKAQDDKADQVDEDEEKKK